MLSPWMSYGNVHDYITANGFVEAEVHRIVGVIPKGLLLFSDSFHSCIKSLMDCLTFTE